MAASAHEESADLAARLGHRFDDVELLDRALSHRSWCAEHGGAASNERLEFLGDAVLGWVIADRAFRRYHHLAEGDLTDLRKHVVNATALAEVARALGLGEHVRLGRGEAAAGGADKPSILSDTFEAVLGAVYLDGGADEAYRFVERHVAPRLARDADRPFVHDHKTHLQELCAASGLEAPAYTAVSSGPEHAKVFRAHVAVGDRRFGPGEGRSKKAAEQQAAALACGELAPVDDA